MRVILASLSLLYLTPWLSFTTSEPMLQPQLRRMRRTLPPPPDLTFDVPMTKLRREYDFIVIGSGPGGSTVTNRLTQVKDWSVLLLEAGGDEMVITDIPLIANHFKLTDYNWGYSAQPQEGACLGIDNQRCLLPRGKGMGGSSTINYMMYVRGHPRDYDGWEAMGNPGWGWKNAVRYFKKTERAKGDFANPKFHGLNGNVDIQRVPFQSPLLGAFLKGGTEMGYGVMDYNSDQLIGFSKLQAFLRNGSRCSASKAMLRPIRNRPNLHISKFAHATKILIDPATKRAYGVEFIKNNKRYRVYARKEVILSAGAFNTPQLLMLSGIGPRNHLEELKIPVIFDSPGVGHNLQDHPSMPGLVFLVNETVSIVENRLIAQGPIVAANYFLYGQGPLTSTGAVEGIGFLRSKIAKSAPDHPDLELMFASGTVVSDDGRVVRRGFGLRDDIYEEAYSSISSRDTWTVWPMLLLPESRGMIRLRNANPLSKPLIYENYFSNEHDLETIVEGIKFVIELSKTKAFQRYGTRLHDTPIPACRYLEFASDDYWRCVVRQLTASIHHHCCSAKMGPPFDPFAVVDPRLRVYGVNNLRVIDASIMPKIPAGHTAAPTYMVAEMASDFIKADYGKL